MLPSPLYQVDVYESRFLLPHLHLGRAELRLYKYDPKQQAADIQYWREKRIIRA